MCLATVGPPPTHKPTSRVVLLRGCDQRGFVWFTNYDSSLKINPHACLSFYWPHTQRQVRVEGAVSRLPPDESDGYCNRRLVGNRVPGEGSVQGPHVSTHAERKTALQDKYAHALATGYRLSPDRMEFWQGHDDRNRRVYVQTRTHAQEHQLADSTDSSGSGGGGHGGGLEGQWVLETMLS
eukprot:GDKI01016618.1.p1 GENE.GDKI01016618.1~~GDKI01016618.1.p1  ORF type:complete len:191 (-),score=54.67 GDKI01016618.1:74-616(-)